MKARQFEKHALHNEIKLRYREYFESKLASELVNKPNLFPSVAKVSTAIMRLITRHHQMVTDIIEADNTINDHLYSHSNSGRLETRHFKADAILSDIKSTLTNPNSNLEQVMHVHGVFVYHIYKDLLEKEGTKKEDEKFNSIVSQDITTQSRIPAKQAAQPSTQPGVCKNPVFMHMFKVNPSSHIRGIDSFLPNLASPYTKNVVEKNMPFVAGPSGHARRLVQGAKLYGNLTADELAEYSLAAFVTLAHGGHHTFQEVMFIANKFGVPFQDNNYTASIPQSIRETKIYQDLRKRFPEFLDSAQTTPNDNVRKCRVN